jgi:hypothetical protein
MQQSKHNTTCGRWQKIPICPFCFPYFHGKCTHVSYDIRIYLCPILCCICLSIHVQCIEPIKKEVYPRSSIFLWYMCLMWIWIHDKEVNKIKGNLKILLWICVYAWRHKIHFRIFIISCWCIRGCSHLWCTFNIFFVYFSLNVNKIWCFLT